MSAVGYYTYGVIMKNKVKENIPGIDKKESISAVPFRDIACIISKVSLDEFGETGLKKNLESLDWVKEKAFAHERVIEKIMKKTTIVPMKFCAIFTGIEGVHELLKSKYEYFVNLLEKISGKHEWGFKVYSKSRVSEEITAPASGREYLLGKKIAEDTAQEEEQKINSHINSIFMSIKPLAVDARINRPTSRELLNDETKDQVLNISLLVSDDDAEKLTSLINNLANNYSKDSLTLELTGPLPVYSFLGE